MKSHKSTKRLDDERNTMKHTKRPWKVGNPRKFHDQNYTPIEQPLMGELMTEICWVIDVGEVSLIAAAPELLEALKELVAKAPDGTAGDLRRLIAKAERR